MKRWLWAVLVMLVAGNAFGAFPGVPGDVTPVRVEYHDDAANFYVWMDSEHLYLHVDPITMPFYLYSTMWIAIQNGVQYDMSAVDSTDNYLVSVHKDPIPDL